VTTHPGSALTDQDRQLIQDAFEREWTEAILTRDWPKAVAMCAPDVVYMAADVPIVKGQQALREFLDRFPPVIKFTQPLETVDGQGTIAVGLGTFSATVEVGGRRVDNTGNVMCWFRQDDAGRWKVKGVCWNWDQPMTAV
jgi:ketosteroid isomerase-like protein